MPRIRYAITVNDAYHDNLLALASLAAWANAGFITTSHIGGDTFRPLALSYAIARSSHASVTIPLPARGLAGRELWGARRPPPDSDQCQRPHGCHGKRGLAGPDRLRPGGAPRHFA